ncbi:MAG: hypothetical protein PF904_15375 [Kiritimatiellae bacterium]|jgi:hypothetical protein|nr:hypothetical protein [Kiritimatiellia bacterium]
MNTIEMIQFGSTLTDRTDGKKVYNFITDKYSLPTKLDFTNVVSLGSSFGDEVILPLAEKQNRRIIILKANNVIKNSIRRIVEDRLIEITFVD